MIKVKMDGASFIYNLYLSICFSLYKIEDRRKIKDQGLINNCNIEIKHFGRIKISDKKEYFQDLMQNRWKDTKKLNNELDCFLVQEMRLILLCKL